MKYHVYNVNINNEFLNGIYTSSMHIFLSGFIAEAKIKYDVKLYGTINSGKNVFYKNYISYIRSKFFLFDVILNRTEKNLRSNKSDLIVVFGYNPLVIAQLIILKILKFKTICYIFDSHKVNTSERKIKNNLINFYYGLGFYLARFLTAIVCVNSNFKSKYSKLFSNIIESKVGYSCKLSEDKYINFNIIQLDYINIIYGGTLNKDNGAHLILELVRKSFPFNVRFIVYGFGDLADEFEKEGKANKNLKFIGKQPNSSIKYLTSNSDICIHLRDPNSINKNIAFPSKLIEYIFNSEFILTNDFPALNNQMKQAMINVCDFSIEEIYQFLLVFEKRKKLMIDDHTILCALEKTRVDHDWKNVFGELDKEINSIE